MRRSLVLSDGVRWFVLCAAILVCVRSGVAEDSWLTQPERDFFAALGANAKIDDKPVNVATKLDELPAIAKRATEPLQQRILTIFDATSRLAFLADEKKAAVDTPDPKKAVPEQSKIEAHGGQMFQLFLGALDDGDAAALAVEGPKGLSRKVMSAPGIRDSVLQRDSLARRILAKEKIDSNLTEILSELEQRSGKTRPSNEITWHIDLDGKLMRVAGRTSAEFGSPVVQVIFRRKSAGETSTAPDQTSKKISETLRIELDEAPPSSMEVELLTIYLLAANLPITITELLPDLKNHSKIGFSFPLDLSLSLEAVDVKIWSKEGILTVTNLPGLDIVQSKARKAQEEEALKHMTPKQRQAHARQHVQQVTNANKSLKLAQSQLSAKKLDEARKSFSQVIELAPDSLAATTARAALKRLDEK